jgi:L-ascorbate metabolism protein UlaG (beta-lactamase superfamily)
LSPKQGIAVADQVEITWLGQAGFLFRSASTAIAIDPFLSKHDVRLYPPPPDEALGDRLDYLVATHEHGDHLDVELLSRLVSRFKDLTVVVPSPVVPRG